MPDSFNAENYCIVQPYAAPYDDKFHRVRMGRLRKVYPASTRDRRIYFGPVLEPRNKLLPTEKVRHLIDGRSVGDLERQASDALRQLFSRAHCGDSAALKGYVGVLGSWTKSLELLASHHAKMVREVARAVPDWPLVLNQRDANWARRELKKLGVGNSLPVLGRGSLRVKLSNRWVWLAWHALVACAENKRAVPALRALTKGAQVDRRFLSHSRQKKAWATFYYRSDGDVVIIADWQADCVKLPNTCTKANISKWWSVVKECVLHYWLNPRGNYLEVLASIPDATSPGNPESDEYFKRDKEFRKRSHALARVEQAFEGLVGAR